MLVSASSAGEHRHVSDRPVSDRPVCIGGYYKRFYSLARPADKKKRKAVKTVVEKRPQTLKIIQKVSEIMKF